MIVGIGFNFQVGKDTAATALGRELGFVRVGFADALKEMALIMDPLVSSQTRTANIGIGRGRLAWVVQGLGWDDAKRTYPEVRTFLQNLGTAGRRILGEDIWIDTALKRAAGHEHVVFSDVRYLNEAEAIKGVGGILINIRRPGHHGDNHPSETELKSFDGWDFVIDNNGTVAELEQQVVRVVREELQRREREAAA